MVERGAGAVVGDSVCSVVAYLCGGLFKGRAAHRVIGRGAGKSRHLATGHTYPGHTHRLNGGQERAITRSRVCVLYGLRPQVQVAARVAGLAATPLAPCNQVMHGVTQHVT